MAIRERLLSGYIGDEEIYESVGHDFLRFLKIFIVYIVVLLLLGVLWYALTTYVYSHTYISYGFAVVGVFIYAKGMIEMLDSYLDALLITSSGLILFKRDGLFKQKVTSLQWVSIETVVNEQNSLRDKVLNKGDITIYVEDEQYSFNDAVHPRRSVMKILEWKDKILGRYRYTEENNEQPPEQSKYELLVEALGEVVTEYVEKKNTL